MCKLALSNAGDLLNCSKLFVRWMHGTCLPTPSQKSGTEEKALFTFYRDISGNPDVSTLMYQMLQTLKVKYFATNYYYYYYYYYYYVNKREESHVYIQYLLYLYLYMYRRQESLRVL